MQLCLYLNNTFFSSDGSSCCVFDLHVFLHSRLQLVDVIELVKMRRALALVEVKRTDIRAIQSNLSQHFLVKVKAGLGVVMTIHHCHIAGAVVAQWGPK